MGGCAGREAARTYILVKTLTGETIYVGVDASDTFDHIKTKIHARLGILLDQQSWALVQVPPPPPLPDFERVD